jgi:type I restriction enzyme R subunit
MRESEARAGELGLAEDELAFYDAVCQNDAAVLELGDDTLKAIAHALVKAVRELATIDWNLKESVLAGLRGKVKRLLTRYDYPPDKQERAIELVLGQAQLFAEAEAA